MTLITFENVGISGISAVVPKNMISNWDCRGIFTDKEIENTIKTTGIEERRFVSDDICASDLCYESAKILLDDLNIEKENIDLLIFASQTPDYHQPATAPMLQHRLGLPKTLGSFDINLACSGYVYGLGTAFSFASQKGVNRVLLLVGETLTKTISKKDRATSLLFGDAGSATLVEKNENFKESYFSFNSDGGGDWVLKIPGGGYRNPSSEETLKDKEYEDGSVRNDEQLYMDGMEVFTFSMQEVPKDIKKILEYSSKNIDEIDYIVFHQANKYMTDFFIKKLKYSKDKVPYSLGKFGNTSSVSIPLTIVTEMKEIVNDKKIILCGFGAGLSWATSLLEILNCHISELGEI